MFEGGIVSADRGRAPRKVRRSRPLLANVALHVLGRGLGGRGGQRLGELVRYADDFVVLCATGSRPSRRASWWRRSSDRLGLRLHPDKTRIVAPARTGGRASTSWASTIGRWSPGSGRGRGICSKWPSSAGDGLDPRQDPRPDRPPLRAAAARTWSSRSSTPCCGAGAPTSATATPRRSSPSIDGYVNERLAILASDKHGLRGRNWVTRFNYRGSTEPRCLPPERNGADPPTAHASR